MDPDRYEETVQGYLEHFGVKGMKWGVVRTVSPSGKIHSRRSGMQKLTIAGAGIGSFMGAQAVGAAMNKNGSITGVVASTVGATAAGVLGARAARTMVDKNAAVPASELGGKHLNDKKMTRGEKIFTTYMGISALATAGILVAAKQAQLG